MIIRIIAFLILNFSALAIGGFFTGKGVSSDWYANLNKAPWTPPGWVFGAAWTSIMIFFSVYMAYLWPSFQNKKLLIGIFGMQWLLNVLWNPTFFYFHQMVLGLVIISCLTLLIGYIITVNYPVLKIKSVLLLPYFLWLIIATSLNAYTVFNN